MNEETSDTDSVHGAEPLRYALECSSCGHTKEGYQSDIGACHEGCEWNTRGVWKVQFASSDFVDKLLKEIERHPIAKQPEIRKGMLVSVFWWDAYGVQQDWDDQPLKNLVGNLSFGIITRVSDEAITIAPHLAGSGKSRLTCGDMIIPLCNVVGIQHLPSGEWLIECDDLQRMSWIKKGRYQKL